MVRARGIEEHLQPRGRFVVEHFRNGQKIGQYEFPNSVVNEGKNKLFNVMFNSATPITAWFIGLIDGSGTPTLAAGDTYAQIGGTNGWNEFVAFTETTRLGWGNATSTAQSVTNASGRGLRHQWLGKRLRPVPGRRRLGPQHEERSQRRRVAVGRGPVR